MEQREEVQRKGEIAMELACQLSKSKLCWMLNSRVSLSIEVSTVPTDRKIQQVWVL